MTAHAITTDSVLQIDLDAFHAGQQHARESLFHHVQSRLERLTRKMLGQFRGVHRWEDTADVLQNAQVRLLRSLEAVRPRTVRELFGLATELIRRELLDLARHYGGPMGIGANHESAWGEHGIEKLARNPGDSVNERDELERWTALHVAVANLPVDEREVFSLLFYQGCTQVEAGRLCGVDERTIRRRWRNASVRLHACLGDKTPLSAEGDATSMGG